jgi:hypothetical protein
VADDDPPVTGEPPVADDPPALDEPPVARCPPAFWFPFEFELLQFTCAIANAKHPIDAAIVEKVVIVFRMSPSPW